MSRMTLQKSASRYSERLEELKARANRNPGVAEAMEVFEKAEEVMARARPYLRAMRTRVVYSTSDRSA